MFTAHISPSGEVQTCTDHSMNVAKRSSRMLESTGLSDCGYLSGLLHDCGKFTDKFESYIRSAVNGTQDEGKVIHSFAGVYYLLYKHHRDAPSRENCFSRLTAELLSLAIGGHHGLMNASTPDGQNGFEHRLGKQPKDDKQIEYDKTAIRNFYSECMGKEELEALFQKCVEEVTHVTETIAKHTPENMRSFCFELGCLSRLITSAVVEADRSDTAEFMNGFQRMPCKSPQCWSAVYDSILSKLSKYPNDTPIAQARRAFSEECDAFAAHKPDVYRLNLPTGGGKTLSALRFAVKHASIYQKQRIFYVAPLLSVIEQNARVIRDAVSDDSLILEHHSNMVKDTESEEVLQRTELLQETWDAPIIITTLVRMLETMFSGKMSSVRRFQALQNSIILFDEVQSVPIRLTNLFNGMINFLVSCCHVTVILCSATQPEFANTAVGMHISPDPIVSEATQKRYAELFRRTELISMGNTDLQGITEQTATLCDTAGSVLVICNTKMEATELYELLGTIGAHKYFLSADMCMAHRKAVLLRIKQSLQQGEKTVCISTQLIEAGIDISFGSVIRISAGLDNIVQAAGRCNRNGEYNHVQPVLICRLNGEMLGSLKEISEAQDALEELIIEYKRDPLKFGQSLSSEQAVAYYYHRLYAAKKEASMDGPIGKGNPSLFRLLSDDPPYDDTKDDGKYIMKQAFRKAGMEFSVFDNETMSVIVPYEKGADIIQVLQDQSEHWNPDSAVKALNDAKNYSVQVFDADLRHMMQLGLVQTCMDGKVYYAIPDVYDEQVGLLSGKRREEKVLCDTLIL